MCLCTLNNSLLTDSLVQGSEKDKKKELAEKEERAKKVRFMYCHV